MNKAHSEQAAEFLLRRADEEHFATVRAEALAAQRGIMTQYVVDAAKRMGLITFMLAGSAWVQFRHAGRRPARVPDEE